MCTCLQWLTKEGRIILDGQQWQAGELVSYLLLVSVTLFQFLQWITQKYKNIEGCREQQNEETSSDLTCCLSLFGFCTHVACRFLGSFCRGRRLYFFCLSCWSPKLCIFQCSWCIGLIIKSIKLLASESQRTF